MNANFWDRLRREVQISPIVNAYFQQHQRGAPEEGVVVGMVHNLVKENADLVDRLARTVLESTPFPVEPLRPEDRAQYVMSCTVSAIREAYGDEGSRRVFMRLMGDIEALRDMLVSLENGSGYVNHDDNAG